MQHCLQTKKQESKSASKEESKKASTKISCNQKGHKASKQIERKGTSMKGRKEEANFNNTLNQGSKIQLFKKNEIKHIKMQESMKTNYNQV